MGLVSYISWFFKGVGIRILGLIVILFAIIFYFTFPGTIGAIIAFFLILLGIAINLYPKSQEYQKRMG